MRGVITVNEDQFHRVAAKVRDMAGGSLEGVKVAVWGLTFKARTDDLRESPSVAIIDRLLARGANVRAHDPTVHGPKTCGTGSSATTTPRTRPGSSRSLARSGSPSGFSRGDTDDSRPP